jgi:hypothetical protein
LKDKEATFLQKHQIEIQGIRNSNSTDLAPSLNKMAAVMLSNYSGSTTIEKEGLM